MEREVSSVVSLAVVLIAMSIVITIVSYTMQIGTTFTDDIAQEAVDIQTNITSGQLKDLSRRGEVLMTTASIYNICSQEHNFINSLTYYDKDSSAFVAPYDNLWGVYYSASDYANGGSTLYGSLTYVFPEDYLRDKLGGKSLITVYSNSYGTFDVIVEKQVG